MSFLKISNLSVDYKMRKETVYAAKNVNIEVNKGEIVGLLRPNGAGKTTTFYMITGMIKPTEGTIHLDGKDITRKAMYQRSRFGIGYLPQDESIFRKLTVEDNLRLVLEMSSFTKEEQKNHDEVKKILDSKINITSTCVRIPVLVSHSISVNVEFNKKHDLEEIRNVLSSSPGCKVVDEHKDGGYITPVEAEDKFETFISRIREDSSQPNSINLWVVSDNLLKGAALNAVEIAEALVEKDFYGK